MSAPWLSCDCKESAVKRTVSKEGPNKGKQFWCCLKSKCKFFKFVEHDSDSGGGLLLKQSQLSSVFFIYTDGSCIGNSNVTNKVCPSGWGVVVTKPNLNCVSNNNADTMVDIATLERNADKLSLVEELYGPVVLDTTSPHFLSATVASNNTAELSAIGEALVWLRDTITKSGHNNNNNQVKQTAYIRYDSEYAAKSIQGIFNGTKNQEIIRHIRRIYQGVLSMGCAVVFRHVKGHSNHTYNDRADQLANMAARGATCSAGRYSRENAVNDMHADVNSGDAGAGAGAIYGNNAGGYSNTDFIGFQSGNSSSGSSSSASSTLNYSAVSRAKGSNYGEDDSYTPTTVLYMDSSRVVSSAAALGGLVSRNLPPAKKPLSLFSNTGAIGGNLNKNTSSNGVNSGFGGGVSSSSSGSSIRNSNSGNSNNSSNSSDINGTRHSTLNSSGDMFVDLTTASSAGTKTTVQTAPLPMGPPTAVLAPRGISNSGSVSFNGNGGGNHSAMSNSSEDSSILFDLTQDMPTPVINNAFNGNATTALDSDVPMSQQLTQELVEAHVAVDASTRVPAHVSTHNQQSREPPTGNFSHTPTTMHQSPATQKPAVEAAVQKPTSFTTKSPLKSPKRKAAYIELSSSDEEEEERQPRKLSSTHSSSQVTIQSEQQQQQQGEHQEPREEEGTGYVMINGKRKRIRLAIDSDEE